MKNAFLSKIKNRKIVLIIIAIIAMALLALLLVPRFNQTNQEDQVAAVPREQVLVECRVISFTEIGVLVELSESSSFATLLVEINNEFLPDNVSVGNYLNIYYDGVIVDANPAKFYRIYNVALVDGEASDQKTYSDWNIPNAKIDELEEQELALITTTIQSYLSKASNTSLVRINSILGYQTTDDGNVEAYLCVVKYNEVDVEEWKVVYLLRSTESCNVIKTEILELVH